MEGWPPERWVRASLRRHPSGAGTTVAKGQQGSASAPGQKKAIARLRNALLGQATPSVSAIWLGPEPSRVMICYDLV